MAFKHMRLLKYKVAIAHGARTGTVRKAKKARNHEINKAYSALKKAAKA